MPDEVILSTLSELREEVLSLTQKVEKLAGRSDWPEYLSIKQAAAYTGLSQAHVRRAVKGGTLPASDMGTPDRAVYRIARKDVDNWVGEQKGGPPISTRFQRHALCHPMRQHRPKPLPGGLLRTQPLTGGTGDERTDANHRLSPDPVRGHARGGSA